ncbi:hypothetical protein NDN08_004524 [Rhodosorus marinus]|uniref:BHLH domain-containing protein n=1 Tax=Rhodosorus marinus TaxID=101924 RepID=A0AAV8US37_9RHOD|nr:hypothetical protein NDN08_004524 [Rhodosorus marinus]
MSGSFSTTFSGERRDDKSEPEHFERASPKLSLAVRKRVSERRRREEIHTSFKTLEAVLSSCRGEEIIRGKKWDREKIVHGATEHITEQEQRLGILRAELAKISATVEDVRNEKVELRADKLYLSEELEKLKEENKRLRQDNKILRQPMNREHWGGPDMTGFQAPEPIPMYQVAPPPQAGAIEEHENVDAQPCGAELPSKSVNTIVGTRLMAALSSDGTDGENDVVETRQNVPDNEPMAGSSIGEHPMCFASSYRLAN